METKICSKCGIEKTLDNFRKSGKYYRADCRQCCNEYMKKYNKEHQHENYIKNIDRIKAYREKNKEERKKYMQQYYQEHKDNEEYKEKRKKYNETYIRPKESIDRHKQKNKEWKMKNKEYVREYARNYDNEHREEKNQRNRKWRENNKDKVRIYQQKDYKKRRNDAVLKLKGQVRNMLVRSFAKKGLRKSKKLEEIVKCDIDFLIKHLYQTFKDNYGYEWNEKEPVHIDHIIPLATANTEEDVIKLCHYSNLQLLKAKHNLSKNKSLDWVLPI